MQEILQAKTNPRLTFDKLADMMRERSYAVLSTISKDGRPHSAGVTYAMSDRTQPLALYIVTDCRSKKARNTIRNPNVSIVIPIPRRLSSLPPSSIQFQGKATTLRLSDEASVRAFNRSFVTRRILETQLAQKSDVSIFIRIKPDPVILTYGVGLSIFRIMRHFEDAGVRVEIPLDALTRNESSSEQIGGRQELGR